MLEENDLFERQRRALDIMEQVLESVLRIKTRKSGNETGEPWLN